jgi:hypothetical protein
MQWAFQSLKTFIDLHYRPMDEIELDFTLLPGTAVPDLVWAIVAKDELLSIKKTRWDLVLLPIYISVSRADRYLVDFYENQ